MSFGAHLARIWRRRFLVAAITLLAGLVAHASAYEELAIDAALHGGRDRVVRALLANPLVGQYDQASQLADRLIAENASFLPWAASD